MRKIKFRGKPAINPSFWVYGFLTTKKILRSNETVSAISNGKEIVPIKTETVGEYTGFDDADGTEIYEGDRLVSVEASKKAKKRGEINVEYKVVLNEEYHTWDMEYENGKGVQTIQLDVYRAKKYRVMKEGK